MEGSRVRRLVVLDRDKNLIGIVSLSDIALSGTDEDIALHTLEQISEPSGRASVEMPRR